MKQKLAPFVLSLGAVLFSLLIVEGIVRIFLQAPSPYRADRPALHYVPYASKSTRDYYYPTERLLGVYRILTIGDSFTFGYGNTFLDTYPKRLEQLLNLNSLGIREKKAGANALGRRVEVINLGIPGSSTWQQVETLRKGIQTYKPDLVILQITLNDPELKPYLAPRGALQGGSPEGILRFWRTYSFVHGRISNTASVERYKEYFKGLYTNPEAKKRFEDSLYRMNRITEREGVLFGAMIFPLLSFSLDERYPFQNEHARIGEILTAQSIRHLDLFGAFRGMDPLRLQVIPPGHPDADPHPNEIAHRIAAEELMRWLGKERLVPSDTVPLCRTRNRKAARMIRCRKATPESEDYTPSSRKRGLTPKSVAPPL